MKKPKISVIIPAYNAEKYIEKCLRSVINQTFSDIEIIVIDDASSDRSMEIVKAYQKLDDRVKTISNETNVGPGVTRNAGILRARGDHIYFLDSDDWIEPNALEIAYETIKRTDAQFVEFGVRTVCENGEEISSCCLPDMTIVDRQEWLNGFSKNIFKDVVWNKLFDANWIKNDNIRFDNFYGNEDTVFCLRFYKDFRKAVTISDILHNRRINAGSITCGAVDKRLIVSNLQRVEAIAEILEEQGLLLSDNGRRLLKCYINQTKDYLKRYNALKEDKENVLIEYAKGSFGSKYPFIYVMLSDAFENSEAMSDYIEIHEMARKHFGMLRMVDVATDRLIKEGIIDRKGKMIIYGTGNWGKTFGHILIRKGFNILAFADTAFEKWGGTFCGKEIIPPDDLKAQADENTIVIIASSAFDEIRYGLVKRGIDKEKIIVFDFMKPVDQKRKRL